jgi:hypothetical protein
MPVVLSSRNTIDRWLDDRIPYSEVSSLLRWSANDNKGLQWFAVADVMNNPRFQGHEATMRLSLYKVRMT